MPSTILSTNCHQLAVNSLKYRLFSNGFIANSYSLLYSRVILALQLN